MHVYAKIITKLQTPCQQVIQWKDPCDPCFNIIECGWCGILFVGKCQKWQIHYDMQNSYIRCSIIIINFITSRFSHKGCHNSQSNHETRSWADGIWDAWLLRVALSYGSDDLRIIRLLRGCRRRFNNLIAACICQSSGYADWQEFPRIKCCIYPFRAFIYIVCIRVLSLHCVSTVYILNTIFSKTTLYKIK